MDNRPVDLTLFCFVLLCDLWELTADGLQKSQQLAICHAGCT